MYLYQAEIFQSVFRLSRVSFGRVDFAITITITTTATDDVDVDNAGRADADTGEAATGTGFEDDANVTKASKEANATKACDDTKVGGHDDANHLHRPEIHLGSEVGLAADFCSSRGSWAGLKIVLPAAEDRSEDQLAEAGDGPEALDAEVGSGPQTEARVR